MAITAGKYIIRSALDEDLVVMVSGGSKSKGAKVTTGALTETDNRCYWHAAIVSNTYNSFYNQNTYAKKNNKVSMLYMIAASVANNKPITQGAYTLKTGGWKVVSSGNTMEVNGADVNTYFLKPIVNENLYLTVPNNGGDLYIAAAVAGTPSTVTVTTSSEDFSVEVNKATFQTAVDNTAGSYAFSYDGTNWSLDGSTISLNTYGITIEKSVASEESSETFTSEVNQATFSSAVNNISGTYVFTYDGTDWSLNSTVVSLATYGISVNGTSVNGDTITVTLAAIESGSTFTIAFTAYVEPNTASQEFYFEATTYVNKSLATPNTLRTQDDKTYIIKKGTGSFYPKWKSSSSAIIYEMRYRNRSYDEDGLVIDDWSPWNGWTKIQATPTLDKKKKYQGIMKSNTAISTPNVDNIERTKVETQVQVRLTSAKNSGAYNKNTITHGTAVSQIINHWCNPTFAFSAALYSPDGLALTYTTDYKVAGSTIVINSIKDNGVTLIENYKFSGQDFTGDLYLNCDELYSLPHANDTIVVKATLTAENGVAKATVTNTLTVVFDSSWGLSLNPTYALTNRLTVLASIEKYSTIQLYMEKPQLDGESYWVECDKVYEDDEDVVFEFAPPFGKAPNLMWLAIDDEAQWTNSISAPSGLIVNSPYYTWYWTDKDGLPHTAILKYNIDKIMQPSDDITLAANKFVTTGREYPVFRYSKSIERILDIEGVILKNENDLYCTLADFESMAVANHCIYRQPDGKWFQVAIESIKFDREELYTKVTISQEAETR